jgi:hypothetical protein
VADDNQAAFEDLTQQICPRQLAGDQFHLRVDSWQSFVAGDQVHFVARTLLPTGSLTNTSAPSSQTDLILTAWP